MLTYTTKEIRRRLQEELARVGVSMRQASIKAGKSAGYLHSVLKDGNDPTISSLTEICQTNGLNLPYVLTGLHIEEEAEELLRLAHAHPERRKALMILLQDDLAGLAAQSPDPNA